MGRLFSEHLAALFSERLQSRFRLSVALKTALGFLKVLRVHAAARAFMFCRLSKVEHFMEHHKPDQKFRY